MPLWFAALLGLVQGLTEFLPVSSTAHLRIVPALVGRPDPGAAYTAVIQLGTLAAVLAYFAGDLVRMTRGLVADPRGPDARLALLVLGGTLPIGVAGLALEPLVVGPLRSLWVVVAALVGVALVLWAADRHDGRGRRLHDLRLGDALIVGAAQALALVPGVSRSGATIAAALFVGMRRDDAARFSFLLSIPAIAAAGLFELPDAVRNLGAEAAAPLAVGTAVAALTGYASIAWLLRHLRTRSLSPFVVYRIGLGALLSTLLWAGLVSAR